MKTAPDPWNELMALARNDLHAALAWRLRWLDAMETDTGLGDALVRLFDDPNTLLRALPDESPSR